MPYDTVADLPGDVKGSLPAHAQSIWLSAFNQSFKDMEGEARQDVRARMVAWAAVKRTYKQDEKGNWVPKEAARKAQEPTSIYVDGPLDEDLEKAVRSFSQESLAIQRSRRGAAAQQPHPFKAGTWRTRKGVARCLACGRGQPEDGDFCGGLADAVTKMLTDDNGIEVTLGEPQSYAMVKSSFDQAVAAPTDKRYTFTVVYKASPDGFKAPVLDAHNEFATEDELRAAQKGYIEAGDRNIYLQHGLVDGLGMHKIGEWTDIATIPWEVTTDFVMPSTGKVEKRTIPANSVWMGIEWSEEAWPAVKSGQISGLSFGGRAARRSED